jgi:hypothetical protein
VPPKDRIVIYLAESEKEAFETEEALIWYYGRKSLGNGRLINLTDGGGGVSGAKIVRSEESKRKQSATMLGTKKSDYTKQKCSISKRKPSLVGETFSRWYVVARGKTIARQTYYLCRCSCGNTKEITRQSLLRGTSKSCGCLRRRSNDWLRITKETQSSTCGDCIVRRYADAFVDVR